MPKVERRYDFTSNIDGTCDDATWEILKAYFEFIKPIEKYYNVSLSYIFEETMIEVYGKKNPEKYSRKKLEKIKEKIQNKLRIRYGKYITLSQLIWHRRSGNFRFVTNFNCTYKTRKGYLYGHYKTGRLRQLFYTSHCLQRFEERINKEQYAKFKKVYKKVNGVYPIANDIIDFLICCSYQYGIAKDYRYLNIYFGTLVVEVLKDVYIVKTFLLPEMHDERKVDWYKIIPNKYDEDNEGVMEIDSMTDFFFHKAEKDDPIFFDKDEELPQELVEIFSKDHKCFL